MEEVWKDIKNYEGYYQISNLGNVKNIITNKILVGDINNAGYKRITLYTPQRKRFYVHRLVAFHFCEGYCKDLVVNHKDGNKLNNNADNLEWVTRSENDKHAYRNNLRYYNKPSKNPISYPIETFDIETGVVLKKYDNKKHFANEIGCSVTSVSAMIKVGYYQEKRKNQYSKKIGVRYDIQKLEELKKDTYRYKKIKFNYKH